ncbi:Hypothetical protein R9X50_00387700 [Acrodontium crateriforme]|uniref:non-specific serine/threonine protein kinase n=1 Tax=Acrodontium crateriforme TaxID=150365 RepID=A0AAQ3M503_9PEZI|nr:Hypothetical protein R9X50_00387700 [Acrodontium crateriforme]
MDPSHLAPVPFDGPRKELAIQDANDMYQAVLRNAERANSAVPPYDFLELIGKGGSGRVYKCRKQDTREIVAVKIVNIDEDDYKAHALEKDDAIASFRKEVGILQQLKDSKAQNVNLIHDAFDIHNQLWIVCDYCTGGSVRTLMRANPPPNKGLEEHFIIPIARELAVALKSVHDIGVIHRDIKCTNVYINEEGDIQLGDFGIVGVGDDGSNKRKTIIGTPHYMPREMLMSDSLATAEGYSSEVDIWSYGCTVYEMATGHPPNATVNFFDLHKVINTAPRLEGGNYSQELRDFVAFCLNIDPAQRPTADAVMKHPYIENTSKKYPTRNLVRLIDRYTVWEYKGGQRQSLFAKGGASAPSASTDDPMLGDGDTLDWNFSTSDNFNLAFGQRYSQMIGTQDFALPGGPTGLAPLQTKDLSPYEQLEQKHQEMSANRGERSLERLWNPESTPYALHTPIEPEPNSDLPLRSMTSGAPTRESLIDLNSATAMDDDVPTFNFDFGDGPTLKARGSRVTTQSSEEEEEYTYGVQQGEKRATMDWTFPSTQVEKRATMEWTFPSTDSSVLDSSPAQADSDTQLPARLRPMLKHSQTEPAGQFVSLLQSSESPALSSSPPVRSSVGSMIDLDMSLPDPSEIARPSTASSATGSVMTDATSGNPFDLEDDPTQIEVNRDRFSYHKQWQSEGGPVQRRSHKTMPMHSRGSSLSAHDDLNVFPSDSSNDEGIFDHDYRYNGGPRPPLLANLPSSDTDNWPDFTTMSVEPDPIYTQIHIPQALSNGASPHESQDELAQPLSSPRDLRQGRHEVEFPVPEPAHPDSLQDDSDRNLMKAELDRLLRDLGNSLESTSNALRQHTGIHEDSDSPAVLSSTDTGAASTGDEDGF